MHFVTYLPRFVIISGIPCDKLADAKVLSRFVIREPPHFVNSSDEVCNEFLSFGFKLD